MVKQKRGRKELPANERKVAVQLYITQQQVNNLGGLDQTKLLAIKYLTKNANKKLSTTG